MAARTATLLALAWIVGVAWFGWQTAPVLPLDVSAGDPATLEALNAARLRHGLTYAAIALLPAAIVLWLARRRGN